MEISAKHGAAGLLDFSERGNAPWIIGVLLAKEVLSENELFEFLNLALARAFSENQEARIHKIVVGGALHALDDEEQRGQLLKAVATGLSAEETAQLLTLAPFRKATWKLVDAEDDIVQSRYWDEVGADWVRDSDIEASEAVDRLLKAGRPRAAFASLRMNLDKADSQVLFRVLNAVAQGGNDQPGHYMLEHYHVEKAFKRLNRDTALTIEQKAGLEFAFIDVLVRSWDTKGYGIPNLERYIADHPEVFVQALTWTYKRRDRAVDGDPPESQLPPDRRKVMADRGRSLLEALRDTPGRDKEGDLKTELLVNWTNRVRELASELSRGEVADNSIGHLLSHAPIGKDGIWPCEPVREVMEQIQSEELMRGAWVGVVNSRGAHWRGEGGDQERELASKYRRWGEALQLSHPFVSSMLLMELAKSYDHEASGEDTAAGIRRRLR